MDARPRLLDEVRDHLRTLHYSCRTEQQYLFRVRRFILFHGKRHPADMAAAEVGSFLTHLAVERQVSASTQNQALAALLFLYQKVLQVELPWLDGVVRAKPSRFLPVVLTPGEAKEVLSHLQGEHWPIASLLYGACLRLREALTLRVKDVQFDCRQLIVRSGKGGKDRSAILPDMLVDPLRQHLAAVGCVASPSCGSRDCTAPRERSGQGGEHCEARLLPHLTAQLRHPPPGARVRHPHGAGTAGAQGRQDDADLQPRDAQGCERRAESARSLKPQAGFSGAGPPVRGVGRCRADRRLRMRRRRRVRRNRPPGATQPARPGPRTADRSSARTRRGGPSRIASA